MTLTLESHSDADAPKIVETDSDRTNSGSPCLSIGEEWKVGGKGKEERDHVLVE